MIPNEHLFYGRNNKRFSQANKMIHSFLFLFSTSKSFFLFIIILIYDSDISRKKKKLSAFAGNISRNGSGRIVAERTERVVGNTAQNVGTEAVLGGRSIADHRPQFCSINLFFKLRYRIKRSLGEIQSKLNRFKLTRAQRTWSSSTVTPQYSCSLFIANSGPQLSTPNPVQETGRPSSFHCANN